MLDEEDYEGTLDDEEEMDDDDDDELADLQKVKIVIIPFFFRIGFLPTVYERESPNCNLP